MMIRYRFSLKSGQKMTTDEPSRTHMFGWKFFKSLSKAKDYVRWFNFQNSSDNLHVVVYGPDDDFVVLPYADAIEQGFSIISLEQDLSNLSYQHIESIRIDENPAVPWEDIYGMFAMMNNQVLRYILENKIPLKKLIRYELAIRGYDALGDFIGFDKAKELWLK